MHKCDARHAIQVFTDVDSVSVRFSRHINHMISTSNIFSQTHPTYTASRSQRCAAARSCNSESSALWRQLSIHSLDNLNPHKSHLVRTHQNNVSRCTHKVLIVIQSNKNNVSPSGNLRPMFGVVGDTRASETLEVCRKHLCQLDPLRIVCLLVTPRLPRVHHVRWDAGELQWY